jgi:hypothetical protein
MLSLTTDTRSDSFFAILMNKMSIPHMWQNIHMGHNPKTPKCLCRASTAPYRNVAEPTVVPTNPGQRRVCNIKTAKTSTHVITYNAANGYSVVGTSHGSLVASTWPPPSNK